MSGIVTLLAPALFAQAPATGPTPAAAGDTSMVMLAVRRWWSGLTLSPVETVPSWEGLTTWLVGLALLLLTALIAQGPGRALRQLVDVPGLSRLLSRSIARLKGSTRLIGLVVGVTVLTWSSNQFFFFENAQGREDQTLVLSGKSLLSLATEQGALAAATPLRDVFLLGSMVPLMFLGAGILFHHTSEGGSSVQRILSPRAGREALWGTIAWGTLGLHAVYRFLSLVYTRGELPLGGMMFVEALIVPALMAVSDGVILAWVLVEIRNAGLGDAANDALDLSGLLALLPGTILACALLVPARYVAATIALILPYVPGVSAPAGSPGPAGFWIDVLVYIRWQLGHGLIVLQGAALAAIPVLGAAAWTKGRAADVLHGAWRTLETEGGRLVALVAALGIACFAGTTVAYVLVLAIPTQTWVLAAADAYAHYATLPFGLILVSGLIELSRRSLTRARSVEPVETAADAASNPAEAVGVG